MNILLLVSVLFPFVAALATLGIKNFSDRGFRQKYVGAVLVVNILLEVAALVTGGQMVLFKITEKLVVLLKVDSLSMLFGGLVAAMWLLSGIFSFEYMKHEENNERYYLFFLLTLGALNGLGFAGNYLTLYLCFEAMTLLSFPLVLHSGTPEATAAAIKYLFYSIFGASLGLIGFFFANNYCDTIEFLPGGSLNLATVGDNKGLLLVIVFLAVMGFGAKAGMFPLHAWLPTGHPVAPAPASAVLSGVITKAGVLAICRVVFFTFGADFIRGTWVQYTWMGLTLLTVFMGSMLAFKEDLLKKRLAYSSVSQVSYVLFGLSTLTVTGMTGSFLHVIGHSVVKDMLFMCAGAIIYKTHFTYVHELKGIGKRMPIVMWCWTIGGLSLVGVPPCAGFISKWFLATGSLETGIPVFSWLGPVVLLTSAFLTAGYLITVSISAFLPGADFDYSTVQSAEPNKFMTIPLIILAVLAVVLGMFATPFVNFFNGIANTLL